MEYLPVLIWEDQHPWHMPVIPQEAEAGEWEGGHKFEASPELVRPCLKNQIQMKVLGVTNTQHCQAWEFVLGLNAGILKL
jgi:hypothetical protein